jgi:hypothetical protein
MHAGAGAVREHVSGVGIARPRKERRDGTAAGELERKRL